MKEILPTMLPSRLIKPPIPSSLYVYHKPTQSRNWELSINWKTKIYLTENEKNYFLEQLANKKRIIVVGNIVLTPRFDYIIPIYVEEFSSGTSRELNSYKQTEDERKKSLVALERVKKELSVKLTIKK